jgi:hypothetical protein
VFEMPDKTNSREVAIYMSQYKLQVHAQVWRGRGLNHQQRIACLVRSATTMAARSGVAYVIKFAVMEDSVGSGNCVPDRRIGVGFAVSVRVLEDSVITMNAKHWLGFCQLVEVALRYRQC